MRSIKKIHRAVRADMGELITYRAMPQHGLEHLDPFLFVNHHGPQLFPPNNLGLPFGPHPHRGFETLTFVVQGSLVHADSTGVESNIETGGIQWMTAGRGIVHSELASEQFKKEGGWEEIIQLWLNLPARLKGVAPRYTGLQKKDLPVVQAAAGRVSLIPVSGHWLGTPGAVGSLAGIEMSLIEFKEGGHFTYHIPKEHNILFYVVRGKLLVNEKAAEGYDLVEFHGDNELLSVEAQSDSLLILGHAQAFEEPIVSYGPFVMNSAEEIREAYADYQAGKFA